MAVGAHRRRRPAPRLGRAAVWTGLFLALAVLGIVVSRRLWPGVIGGLLGFGPQLPPQASVIRQATCAADALPSVNRAGDVLLAVQGGAGAAGAAGSPSAASTGTVVTLVSGDEAAVVLTDPGFLLAAAFADPDRPVAPGSDERRESDWRVVLARGAAEPASQGGGIPGFLAEEAVWVEASGPAPGVFRTSDGFITAAAAWVDGGGPALGLYLPGVSGEPESRVVIVGSAGEELASHVTGSAPLHRVRARPGIGFIVAASPGSVFLLDDQGNLLWAKSFRSSVADVAVQSHGGPAAIVGGKLQAYDRRGNLVWRKEASSPMTAVAAAAGRLAVAAGREVLVYDEDGLERWALTCAAEVRALALDSTASLLAVVTEDGRLLVARAPEAPPIGWRHGGATWASAGVPAPVRRGGNPA